MSLRGIKFPELLLTSERFTLHVTIVSALDDFALNFCRRISVNEKKLEAEEKGNFSVTHIETLRCHDGYDPVGMIATTL